MSDIEQMTEDILRVSPFIFILDLLFSAGIISLFAWLFSLPWGTTIGFYLIINILWAVIDLSSFFFFWVLAPLFFLSLVFG